VQDGEICPDGCLVVALCPLTTGKLLLIGCAKRLKEMNLLLAGLQDSGGTDFAIAKAGNCMVLRSRAFCMLSLEAKRPLTCRDPSTLDLRYSAV
jgi:hypothetical protein